MINSNELRKKFLEFFIEKKHAIISSASLVPENDPTVLFNTAGMQPLVPYLLGEKHPEGNRLANYQKCLRTTDLEEVGDDTHLTYFEMLGNWSLGDYFKKESITWSYEFLTSEKWLNLDPKKIAVTVFAGDDDAPRDEEAAKLWKEVGMPIERISYLGKEDNWWGPAGETGPCGPDTEIFYWVGESEFPPSGSNVETDEDNWMEIWNNVFMEYNKRSEEKASEEIKKDFDNLTSQIIGIGIDIHRKYKNSLTEKQFNKMFFDKLESKGLKVERERKIEIIEDGKKYGNRFVDLVVEGNIFIELKNNPNEIEIKKGFRQLRSYLELGNGVAGLILNFAFDKLGISKFNNYESESFKKILQTSLFSPLLQKNVDTGMGLERITTTINGKKNVYETDVFEEILKIIGVACSQNYNTENKVQANSFRIIADHSRTSVFLLSDGVLPGNVDQSYVLRRLIRRAILQMQKLGVSDVARLFEDLADSIITKWQVFYPDLENKRDLIFSEIKKEGEKFEKALTEGRREFDKLLRSEESLKKEKRISGKQAFKLYDTYGLPIDVTKDLAHENNLTVDEKGFEEAFKKHQELSRQASEQKFKGGLADDSEICSAYHTATHLLHQALRDILGHHVEQKGSNITAERMRFDFSHDQKMTDEEKKKVENIINEQIEKSLPVSFVEMTVEEAKDKGAIGLFEAKYGEKVKVYSMGDFSKEICGGPHMNNTGEILDKFGRFKIKKEEASSAGVRRIRGVFVK